MIAVLMLLVIAVDVVSDALEEDGNDWVPERQSHLALVESTTTSIEAIVAPPEQRVDIIIGESQTRHPIVAVTWSDTYDPSVDPPPVNPA